MNKTPTPEPDSVRQRLRDAGLYGLAAQDDTVLAEPWVEHVIDIEDRERKRRSLERRLTNARISAFKPIADFDWAWPNRIDRPLIEELFSLDFIRDATNVVLVGPNGIGKTMRVKNLLHHAVLNGFTARFAMASDMLHELAAQDSDASLARRLRRFTQPQLLAINEVGYLNDDNRYADLLFEVVTRRYLNSSVLITTNKPFSEWTDVFSSAACVVTKRARASERNPRRPPHPSLRHRPARRRKLSTQGSQGALRQTLQSPLAPLREVPSLVRNLAMNDHPTPLIAVPNDLSDEAAAKLLAFLYELTHLLESHYADPLHRYHNRPDARQADLWSETDPPF